MKSPTCVITISTGAGTFVITDIKLYVSVVNLSTQGNAKLLEQLKSGFKRTVNWNKYQSKVSTERQKQYLNHLFGPSFQGVNSLFLLSFENNAESSTRRILSPKSRKKRLQCQL